MVSIYSLLAVRVDCVSFSWWLVLGLFIGCGVQIVSVSFLYELIRIECIYRRSFLPLHIAMVYGVFRLVSDSVRLSLWFTVSSVLVIDLHTALGVYEDVCPSCGASHVDQMFMLLLTLCFGSS